MWDPLNLVSADAEAEFQRKLTIIREYLQHLAQEWWQSQPEDRQTAICDSCSVHEIHREGGFLIGSNLWCGSCYNGKAEHMIIHKGEDAALGVGVMGKAMGWRLQKVKSEKTAKGS